jgi:hypothetical protein
MRPKDSMARSMSDASWTGLATSSIASDGAKAKAARWK